MGLDDFAFFDSPPHYETPERISDVWTDAVLHQRGYPGVRGLGGRIIFHAAGDRPVRADGTLIVYAYDESGDGAEREVPDRKFVFPADKLQDRYSPSDLGPSYSVWLPWGELGGLERRITLIPRFEVRNGQVVLGQPSTHVLPGRPPEPAGPTARGNASSGASTTR